MLQLRCFLVGFKVWTDPVPEAQPNALTAALRKPGETAGVADPSSAAASERSSSTFLHSHHHRQGSRSCTISLRQCSCVLDLSSVRAAPPDSFHIIVASSVNQETTALFIVCTRKQTF
ncbi:hypothetical protein E2C01_051775 [Portunus trituberculatus]|uniref:Uncharacterized protein n=1 Tax=Portunus trituberculatus TaxID=210409 RepID=A0A5B7GKG6_PORTR|nr:hypothetical protein [Portunus trituberculatus]